MSLRFHIVCAKSIEVFFTTSESSMKYFTAHLKIMNLCAVSIDHKLDKTEIMDKESVEMSAK
jgi:hypothetical protein